MKSWPPHSALGGAIHLSFSRARSVRSPHCLLPTAFCDDVSRRQMRLSIWGGIPGLRKNRAAQRNAAAGDPVSDVSTSAPS